MKIDQTKIRDAVIKETVEQLVTQFDAETKIQSEIEERAAEIIEKKVDEQIKKIFSVGIEKLLFPQTNVYGEPKNTTLTLREFIDARITSYLYEQVNYEGKPKQRDSWHADSDSPRLAYLVKQATERQIAEIVKASAEKIKDEIGTILGTVVRTQIDNRLSALKK